MHSLHSNQSAFCDAIISGVDRALLPMLAEAEDVARRRLDTYRSNFIGTLSAALESAYPVVAQIVGGAFFTEAARQFILATPSASGDLNEFGEGFGDFLGAYPHAAELAYLPDVARMEWLVQRVFYAADAPAADLALLTRIDAERYGQLCFSVTPAHARLDSRWPLADIWRVNQAGFAGDMTVDFSYGAQLLITRRDDLVYVESLTTGEAVLLDLLAAGQPLATATERAMATDPGFDLGAALRRFVAQGMLWQARFAGEILTGFPRT